MIGYFDEDEDLEQCKDFCALWKQNLPELRTDMYRIISEVLDPYNCMNVYSFNKFHQYQIYWQQAMEIISMLAYWQDCDIQTILDTMPSHMGVTPGRILYVNLTIGGISTAKSIVKYFGTDPYVYTNKYGVPMIKKKG